MMVVSKFVVLIFSQGFYILFSSVTSHSNTDTELEKVDIIPRLVCFQEAGLVVIKSIVVKQMVLSLS